MLDLLDKIRKLLKTEILNYFYMERVSIARSQICTRVQNCTKAILHQRSILHELHFCILTLHGKDNADVTDHCQQIVASCENMINRL